MPETKQRRRGAALAPAAPSPASSTPPPSAPPEPVPRAKEGRPFLLDFLPLQSEKETRLARFFARLKDGHLSTTRCPKERMLDWPPRTACPRCHTEELEWVDLPDRGRLYAFSATLAGAPAGMEADVPFAVGLVDLDGVPLRLFGRIVGRPWNELRIGGPVRVEPYTVDDGRVFYRFRTVD
jgi:uncharacterized protein